MKVSRRGIYRTIISPQHDRIDRIDGDIVLTIETETGREKISITEFEDNLLIDYIKKSGRRKKLRPRKKNKT